jgi:hypothetical protein
MIIPKSGKNDLLAGIFLHFLQRSIKIQLLVHLTAPGGASIYLFEHVIGERHGSKTA